MCLTDGTLQAYFDREMPSGDRGGIAGHLRDCGRCRARADALQARRERVDAALAALAGAPDDSGRAALARFRTRCARETPAPWRAVPWRGWLAAGTLCAAGIVVAVVASPRPAPSAWRSGSADRPGGQTVPSLPSRTFASGGATGTPAAGGPAGTARRRGPAERIPGPAPSEAISYTPLVDGAVVPEMGAVIRVSLPLSVLGPADDDPDSGQPTAIEADVLVGQDGRALAIRLIDQVTSRERKQS